MTYYKENAYGKTEQISKSTYYRLTKRSDAQVTIHTNNGRRVARSVRVMC